MRVLPLLFAVIVISVSSAGCGGDKEPATDGNPPAEQVNQQDPAFDKPAQAGPTDRLGATDSGPPSTGGDPEFDDRPAAVPPIPQNRFVESLGRALINGAKKSLPQSPAP